MKRSQKQRVLSILINEGHISRNQCLDMPYGDKITRLGAIICDLKKDGYDFDTKDDGRDFIYTLKNRPPKVEIEIIEVNGERRAIKREIPR